jgi:hypothetical protein
MGKRRSLGSRPVGCRGRSLASRDPRRDQTVLAMRTLAERDDPDALRAALSPLVEEYGAWITDLADEAKASA